MNTQKISAAELDDLLHGSRKVRLELGGHTVKLLDKLLNTSGRRLNRLQACAAMRTTMTDLSKAVAVLQHLGYDCRQDKKFVWLEDK